MGQETRICGRNVANTLMHRTKHTEPETALSFRNLSDDATLESLTKGILSQNKKTKQILKGHVSTSDLNAKLQRVTVLSFYEAINHCIPPVQQFRTL